MAETTKTHIYEEGNKKFQIAELRADGTYGEVATIEGLISVDCTMSSTTTNTAADDDTTYLTRTSPVTGEGTITFVGLSQADYLKLYPESIKDGNGALVFGRQGSPKRVGISFINTQVYKDAMGEEKVSTNKFTINNVVFQMPNISTTTVSEDSTNVREFELSFNAYPYNFPAENPTDRVTWSIVNSADIGEGAKWSEIEKNIYVPNKDYSGS